MALEIAPWFVYPCGAASQSSIKVIFQVNRLILLFHAAALAALFAALGTVLASMSVDLAWHYTVVNEIMNHGAVRPDAAYLGSMAMYPPLSHWLAATLGWLTGSGLVAMWLISIAAIYFSYFAILLVLGEESAGSVLVFVILFALLKASHSMLGNEVIRNFFYPQLVGSAVYFAALTIILRKQLSLTAIGALTLLLNPILFFLQPIVGVHLAAAALMLILADTAGKFLARREVALWSAAVVSILIVVEVILLMRLPKVAALMSFASNNGALVFNFPGHADAVFFVAGLATCMANLWFGIRRWPDGALDRIFGAAGTAAGLLMLLQLLLLVTLGAGSPYAVKKHGFLLMTLVAINLARLIARRLPAFSIKPFQSYWAIGLAFVGTFLTCQSYNRGNAVDAISALRYANQFVQNSSQFEPGTVSADINTLEPTLNLLISVASFERDSAQAVKAYGKLDTSAQYVMINKSDLKDPSCAIAQNLKYAIAPPSCVSIKGP